MSKRDAIRNMTQTDGWKHTEEHIQQQIAYNRNALMDCKDWEEVKEHRAKVEVLSAVLVHIEQTIRGEGEDDGG